MNTKLNGFTLLELIIVIGIIASLAVLMFTSYTAVQRSARDSRRKADLEQIRSAFEQWRSDYGSYPTALNMDNCANTSLISGSNIYLQTVPKDPQCPTRAYKGVISASDYTLGAGLESITTVCANLTSPACGVGIGCSYCVGPYGQRPL